MYIHFEKYINSIIPQYIYTTCNDSPIISTTENRVANNNPTADPPKITTNDRYIRRKITRANLSIL